MPISTQDWRVLETLKLLRQCRTCPYCGALISRDEGEQAHIEWHNGLNDYVASVENNFNLFQDYIQGGGGMEEQIITAFNDMRGEFYDELQTLRTDATNAINQLRTDATNAIIALQNRVTALENAL